MENDSLLGITKVMYELLQSNPNPKISVDKICNGYQIGIF